MEVAHSILGHTMQMGQLRADCASDNISHAYLFAGKRHLGKFSVAKWFASHILTLNQSDGQKEKTVDLMKKNVHPDLLVLDQLWIDGICTDWDVIARSSTVPQQHRAKAKVKTDTIGIDDIRELQVRLHETPQESSKMCCLIRSIERLHMTASNALLKILEEPPKHVHFCFTTESLSSLPPTIVSRMRVLQFYPVPAKEMEPFLTQFDQEDQSLLLTIAEGCPGLIDRCVRDTDQLRSYKQAHIDADHFLSTASSAERMNTLKNALEKNEMDIFLRHIFMHLQKDLRSENRKEVLHAVSQFNVLFSLLHSLQSNTQKPLLAVHAALQSSMCSER